MEKESKGVRTKRQLYQCAMKLFRARGFDRVSVDEIVREAGMAKGTFYIYFSSKSDIILEMLRQYDTYYDQIMASLPDGLSIDAQMEEIVRGACRFTEEVIGLDLIRVLYAKQLGEGQEHPGLLNEDRALYRIVFDLLMQGQAAGIYDPALSVPDTTRLILRGIRATFFEWCSSNGQFDLTEACLYFVHTLRRGIYHTAK